MATQAQPKRGGYRPRYEQKEKPATKFNFVFDEEKVTFKTEIPELPAKPRSKPDEKSFTKKVTELESRLNELKDQRRKKKLEYKKSGKNFDQEINTLKSKIELGKKCLVVLKYDKQDITKNLAEVEQKIQNKARKLKNLQRGPRVNTAVKKAYEQMNYQQLEAEENRLSVKISTANLSKKEQSQINSLLAKLARFKLSAPRGQKPKDNTAEIQNLQQSLDRLKQVKKRLQDEAAEVDFKIESIEQSIQDFGDEIDSLEEEKKNNENEEVYEESKKLKTEIYRLRDEIAAMKQEFETKKAEYDYELAKIEWINWATQVKQRKVEEWEAGREQRRRQKLRQKNKQEDRKGEKTGQESKPSDARPEDMRPRFNANQKQIDTCTFLISYCEDLTAKTTEQKKQETRANKPDLQDALKTGEWSKVKGVEVIKPKKLNIDQQQQDRKPKKKTNKKIKDEGIEQKQNKFNHNFFIQQAFDLIKVVAPTTPEEAEHSIKDLQTKLDYYLKNPTAGQSSRRVDTFKQKPKQPQGKGKYSTRQPKVINTEEFPSLN